jgi:hypothetical protein
MDSLDTGTFNAITKICYPSDCDSSYTHLVKETMYNTVCNRYFNTLIQPRRCSVHVIDCGGTSLGAAVSVWSTCRASDAGCCGVVSLRVAVTCAPRSAGNRLHRQHRLWRRADHLWCHHHRRAHHLRAQAIGGVPAVQEALHAAANGQEVAVQQLHQVRVNKLKCCGQVVVEQGLLHPPTDRRTRCQSLNPEPTGAPG